MAAPGMALAQGLVRPPGHCQAKQGPEQRQFEEAAKWPMKM
jgi:hypothetical protein